jgi:AMP-polyphosphate phosphotransferase
MVLLSVSTLYPSDVRSKEYAMLLTQADLTKKLDKKKYKSEMPRLQLRAGELQRALHEKGVPVIIVFEGWGASGKGTQINNLILSLDPRGFNVNLTKPPNEEEYMRPFLWRFWLKMPSAGRIAIFDRSWYRRVLNDRVEKNVPKDEWRRAFGEIESFERQITDDGAIVLKFFLHIGKKVQRKRFEALEENPATAWKVTKSDWRQNRRYDRYVTVINDMLKRASFPFAPWTVVEADDQRFASVKILKAVIAAMTAGLRRKRALRPPVLTGKIPRILDIVDLSASLSREEYEARLKERQARLRDLGYEIYRKRVPVIVVYEGWDAAGKGGNIRRLAQSLDPRGYEVVPVSAPNDVEKTHHYLWRFWRKVPKAGHITVFDRSWYGRVMVERVERFCSEAEWKRAYGEINEFEAQCADSGTVIVKFWLHIDRREQLSRFHQRENISYKRWKITGEDWRNRRKWDAYRAAVDEMLFRTGTKHAPWTVVEANNKLFARIKTIDTVIAAIERRL